MFWRCGAGICMVCVWWCGVLVVWNCVYDDDVISIFMILYNWIMKLWNSIEIFEIFYYLLHSSNISLKYMQAKPLFLYSRWRWYLHKWCYQISSSLMFLRSDVAASYSQIYKLNVGGASWNNSWSPTLFVSEQKPPVIFKFIGKSTKFKADASWVPPMKMTPLPFIITIIKTMYYELLNKLQNVFVM